MRDIRFWVCIDEATGRLICSGNVPGTESVIAELGHGSVASIHGITERRKRA